MPLNLGYCCINNTLRTMKPQVYSSRGMIRKNFSLAVAAERGLQNVKDILTILKWNDSKGIKTFRIGSEPLPRAGDWVCGYNIEQLSNYTELVKCFGEIGDYAKSNGHNLSFHPGQYVCLGSPNESVANMGKFSLEKENQCVEAIAGYRGLDIPINIHIGGSYGDYSGTAKRFVAVYKTLSESLKSRLVIENDDKMAGWSVKMLYNIYQEIGTPITFDFHHWLFKNETDGKNDPDSLRKDFELAKSTWGERNMQIHYSQSPTPEKLIPKHSMFYRDPLPSWLDEYDNCHIHLECKAKELALLKYRVDFEGSNDIIDIPDNMIEGDGDDE